MSDPRHLLETALGRITHADHDLLRAQEEIEAAKNLISAPPLGDPPTVFPGQICGEVVTRHGRLWLKELGGEILGPGGSEVLTFCGGSNPALTPLRDDHSPVASGAIEFEFMANAEHLGAAGQHGGMHHFNLQSGLGSFGPRRFGDQLRLDFAKLGYDPSVVVHHRIDGKSQWAGSEPVLGSLPQVELGEWTKYRVEWRAATRLHVVITAGRPHIIDVPLSGSHPGFRYFGPGHVTCGGSGRLWLRNLRMEV